MLVYNRFKDSIGFEEKRKSLQFEVSGGKWIEYYRDPITKERWIHEVYKGILYPLNTTEINKYFNPVEFKEKLESLVYEGIDDSGWIQYYRDQKTGEQWSVEYPQGYLNGGGPATLGVIEQGKKSRYEDFLDFYTSDFNFNLPFLYQPVTAKPRKAFSWKRFFRFFYRR